MSGVEVFALVTGVMTVITFAADTVVVCKALYDGQSVHQDLETKATALKDAATQMQAYSTAITPHSADEKNLVTIAQKCQTIAANLLAETAAINPVTSKGNLLKSFKRTMKSFAKSSKLQKMEASLNEYQSILQTEILTRIW